jgi:hypothetical protein
MASWEELILQAATESSLFGDAPTLQGTKSPAGKSM